MDSVVRRAVMTSLLVLLYAAGQPLYALEETAPVGRDIAVILDVSGSMEEGWIIREVKDWIATELLRSRARPGDRFSLIAFGTRVRLLVNREITGDEDIEQLILDLSAVRTRDHFTDIGSALEGFDRYLDSLDGSPRKPLAIFLTDGKNAPPDFSPWYGKDLSVDDHFKDIGQKIAQRGWVLYVVGLLDDSDAALVAETVPGSTLKEGEDALETAPLDEYIEEREEASMPPSKDKEPASPVEEAPALPEEELEEQPPELPPPVYRFEAEGVDLKDDTDDNWLFSYRGLILAAIAFVVLALTALLVGRGMRHGTMDDDETNRRKAKKAKSPKVKRQKAPKPPKAKKEGRSGAGKESSRQGTLAKGPAAGAGAGVSDDGFGFDDNEEAELAALLAPGPAPKDGPVVASPEADDPFTDFTLE